MKLTDFLSQDAQQAIVDSIRQAEMRTSGEIRVHVEPRCPTSDPCERAVEVFGELKMHETRQRNAVLIYLAYKSRSFAIIGDSGISGRVPSGFWDAEKDVLTSYLKSGQPGPGICEVVKHVGEKLKDLFPPQGDDTNELSDEISIGN